MGWKGSYEFEEKNESGRTSSMDLKRMMNGWKSRYGFEENNDLG